MRVEPSVIGSLTLVKGVLFVTALGNMWRRVNETRLTREKWKKNTPGIDISLLSLCNNTIEKAICAHSLGSVDVVFHIIFHHCHFVGWRALVGQLISTFSASHQVRSIIFTHETCISLDVFWPEITSTDNKCNLFWSVRMCYKCEALLFSIKIHYNFPRSMSTVLWAASVGGCFCVSVLVEPFEWTSLFDSLWSEQSHDINYKILLISRTFHYTKQENVNCYLSISFDYGILDEFSFALAVTRSRKKTHTHTTWDTK